MYLSDKMSSNAIHPQVFSLLKLKDEGRELMVEKKYNQAVRIMQYIYFEVEVKDRNTELNTKIKNEIITLDNYAYPGGIKKRVKTMESVYKQWWNSILITLRTKGYLTNAKHAFVLKEDEKKFG